MAPRDRPAKVEGPRVETAADDPARIVRVRFTAPHTHAGLPFGPDDEIEIESHWADGIERLGSGHRISTPTDKE